MNSNLKPGSYLEPGFAYFCNKLLHLYALFPHPLQTYSQKPRFFFMCIIKKYTLCREVDFKIFNGVLSLS
jgi:hypothetical protein